MDVLMGDGEGEVRWTGSDHVWVCMARVEWWVRV